MLPTSTSSNQPLHHSCSSSSASLAPPTDATDPAAAAAPGTSSSSRLRPEGGRPLGDRARGVLAASATHLDRLVLGSARKLGRNITREALLRPFASAGASLQVGEMRRNFLDFTGVEAVLDLGLNSPEALGHSGAAAAATAARGGASAGRTRPSAGAIMGRGAKGGSSSGGGARGPSGVRSASPARGMTTILGPAAAAAHAAAAAQPPVLPPSVAAGSSDRDSSPRSSTIGSVASAAAAQQPPPAAGSSSGASTAAMPAAAALPPSAPAAGAVGSAGRHKHPAFALDERGVWHALTVSATQQLFGPVRLRADARLALDSVHPCPRGAGGAVTLVFLRMSATLPLCASAASIPGVTAHICRVCTHLMAEHGQFTLWLTGWEQVGVLSLCNPRSHPYDPRLSAAFFICCPLSPVLQVCCSRQHPCSCCST